MRVCGVILGSPEDRNAVGDLIDRAASRATSLLCLPVEVASAVRADEQSEGQVSLGPAVVVAAVRDGQLALVEAAEPGGAAEMTIRGSHVAGPRLAASRCSLATPE
jgi:hypothetical protein